MRDFSSRLNIKNITIGFLTLLLSVSFLSLGMLPTPESHAEQQTTSVGLSIDTVLSLSVANCAGLPDANSYSITFETMPTPTGTFASNCQTLSINTNAPGYSLLAKSNTTNLEYLNPTTVDPIPSITPITSSLSTSPTAITPNHWGFAAKGNNITLNPNTTTYPGLNFTQTYTANNKDNTYSTLPTTDTQLYNTTQIPGKTDQATFWYGTNVDTSQLAGLYSTTVTYTVIGEDVPPAPITFRQISAGYNHTCAIASDNNAYCWGYNDSGELGDDTTDSKNTPVLVKTDNINNKTFKEISAGYQHTCAIGSDDWAYCWGYNDYGELGDDTDVSKSTPVAVSQGAIPNGVTIKQITAGGNRTCAIGSDDWAYCWGYNDYGQIGDGTMAAYPNKFTPVVVSQGAIPNGVTIKQITAVGFRTTCAIGSDSWVYCWGYGKYGQLGNGPSGNYTTTPIAVSQGAIPNGVKLDQVFTAGEYARGHTCALGLDSKAYCWGINDSGELGNGTDGSGTHKDIPVAVSQGAIPNGVKLNQMFTGFSHSCAVGSDNWIYCWGYNGLGQLGDNTNTSRNIPVAISQGTIPDGVTIKQITTGGSRTCVIISDKDTYCWGGNSSGQLGDGTNIDSNVPVKVINPTP